MAVGRNLNLSLEFGWQVPEGDVAAAEGQAQAQSELVDAQNSEEQSGGELDEQEEVIKGNEEGSRAASVG